VIVDCQNCRTRFRLDDDRVPLGGAKVRCSKCKTAFVVQRPAASREELIEEVIAEATSPGASTAPAPTEDLFEISGSATVGFDAEPSGSGDAPSDEKWEFDDASPATSPAGPAEPDAAPSPSAASTAASAELDALGSPEEWDLLGDARSAAADARFDAAAEGHAAVPSRGAADPPRMPSRAPALSVDDALQSAAAAPPTRSAAPTSGSAWLESARELLQSAISSGIWLASIALCVVGLGLALTPRSEAPAISATSLLTTSLASQPIEATRHRIESGVGETLTVLRGHLPRAESLAPTRVRATWVDADGKPLASAIAGRPLSERELRESSLARLRAAHEASALDAARGGAFEVAFAELPAAARGIALEREHVSVPAPAVTHVQVQVEEDAASAAGATTSSRPTARPSSE
jgi:predicted Zn finger-like uncharacterized protein